MDSTARIVEKLISLFIQAEPSFKKLGTHFGSSYSERRKFLSYIFHFLDLNKASEEVLFLQDELLSIESSQKPFVDSTKIAVSPFPKIATIRCDAAAIVCDAVVNQCSQSLLGVCGAEQGNIVNPLFDAAGLRLKIECEKLYRKHGDYPFGSAVLTSGYHLPAKYVIHVVVPSFKERPSFYEEKIFSNCYFNAMKIAEENHLKTIVIPRFLIPGYTILQQAEIALKTIEQYLEKHPNSPAVILNLSSSELEQVYRHLLEDCL